MIDDLGALSDEERRHATRRGVCSRLAACSDEEMDSLVATASGALTRDPLRVGCARLLLRAALGHGPSLDAVLLIGGLEP